MVIKEQHIREAEKLFINGNEFDREERVPFITNLNSCDLLAVPGSGKTTALLAKLYCLSKHLPFKDGSGILVLSHTNAAVDEIEKNLKRLCPNLFEYPNFVGTIQRFVNEFLANNGCFYKYNNYLRTVNDDIANKRIVDNTKNLPFGNTLSNYFFFQTYNQYATVTKKGLIEEYNIDTVRSKEIIKQLKSNGTIKDGHLVYNKVKNNVLIDLIQTEEDVKSIIKDINSKAKRVTDKEKNKRGLLYRLDYLQNMFVYINNLGFDSESGRVLNEIYEDNFSKGIARYKDCYSLAFWYIDKFPEIKSILIKRFKYVFIDEMQDLEQFQTDIIDKIFYEHESPTVIQRIGDINQSIYNSGKNVKVEADWQPRNQLYLKGSNRLTPEIANIVNFFTLDRQLDEEGNPRFIVNGLRQLDAAINPHLILFDNQTIGVLENKFKELIRHYSLHETKEAEKYGFKIIGWNAKWDDDEDHAGKLRLENIFKTYKKEAKGNKETFDSLSKYLQLFDHDKTTLEAASKAVLNSLIHILRIENRTYLTKIRGRDIVRYYSKSEMIKDIQNKDNCDYELFKNKVFQWSFNLATNRDYEAVYKSVKSFIMREFVEWFGLTITRETSDFLGNQFERIIICDDGSQTENTNDDSIKVEIGTVHSAKGQTHCATMYVETSYYEYETQKTRIIESLKKEEHAFVLNNDNKRGKQALKMMYVGFSRPTHLLCFACLKENVVDQIASYKSVGWEVIDLTEMN